MDPKLAGGYDCSPNRRELILLSIPLVHIRYGHCSPHRIELRRGEALVYLWDRIEETRTESFFGTFYRRYEGNQFCFLEYCDIAYGKNRFPEEPDIVGSGLDEKTVREYRAFLERITC